MRLGALTTKFIVDTGASVSILPTSLINGINIEPTPVTLSTATGDDITTHGQANIDVSFPSLRRTFRWKFVVADVKNPLLGFDFLSHNAIIIDCKNKTLVDPVTTRRVPFNISSANINVIVNDSKTLQPEVTQILSKYPQLTKPSTPGELPKSTYFHRINTNSAPPVFAKPRRLSEERLQAAKTEFQSLLTDGIIRRSDSQWASPLHMVEKQPGSGEFRYVGDYRRLNMITQRDCYPIPNLNDVTNKLHNKSRFSKLDLVRAFHQIAVHPDDIPKTAVVTPFGLYEYSYMPFGLRNASSSFQRYMDHIFRNVDCVFTYIDDILIYSDDETSHMKDLDKVLNILNEHNMKISLKKCVLNVSSLNFLGCKISANGLSPTNEKLLEIQNFPCPSDSKSLKRFLGMVGFYRKFIRDFAKLAFPLTECIKLNPKAETLTLSEVEKKSFNDILTSLANVKPLAHPVSTCQHFQLVTDSSNYAIGAALHQMIDGDAIPIGFYSKKLTECERKYSAFDRELLAAYSAVLHFKHQIDGRHVLLLTDHKPLCGAFKSSNHPRSDRQQRHLSILAEYVHDVSFIKGHDNIVADCLSRPAIANSITLDICDFPDLAKNQADDVELERIRDNLKPFKYDTDSILYCDVSLPFPRPYVPLKSRKSVFDSLHCLSHCGMKASLKLVKSRYFWPNMDRDIRQFCRQCLSCQQSKVTRHTKSQVQQFNLPSPRFQSVHIDIVGPLKPATIDSTNTQNYRYVLTCIDRATRWMEAYPLIDISASSVATAFVNAWISRFGVPLHIVTDRGSQFESELFHNLSQIVGFHRLRTTAYHPQSNGMVERLHRTLKSALIARKESWLKALPIVLLGLRAIPNESNFSPFTAVTGTNILLPKLLLSDQPSNEFSDPCVQNLAREMSQLNLDKLSSSRLHSVPNAYLPKNLNVCDKVWLRVDRVRRSLEAPYTGPFKVLQRSPKHFVIELPNGTSSTVSIDRLKPCFSENLESNDETSQEPVEADIAPIPPRDLILDNENSTNQSVPSETTVDDTHASDFNPPNFTPVARSRRKVSFNRNNDFHYY